MNFPKCQHDMICVSYHIRPNVLGRARGGEAPKLPRFVLVPTRIFVIFSILYNPVGHGV